MVCYVRFIAHVLLIKFLDSEWRKETFQQVALSLFRRVQYVILPDLILFLHLVLMAELLFSVGIQSAWSLSWLFLKIWICRQLTRLACTSLIWVVTYFRNFDSCHEKNYNSAFCLEPFSLDIDLNTLNGSTLKYITFSRTSKVWITSTQVIMIDNKCYENLSVITERENICIMGCVLWSSRTKNTCGSRCTTHGELWHFDLTSKVKVILTCLIMCLWMRARFWCKGSNKYKEKYWPHCSDVIMKGEKSEWLWYWSVRNLAIKQMWSFRKISNFVFHDVFSSAVNVLTSIQDKNVTPWSVIGDKKDKATYLVPKS